MSFGSNNELFNFFFENLIKAGKRSGSQFLLLLYCFLGKDKYGHQPPAGNCRPTGGSKIGSRFAACFAVRDKRPSKCRRIDGHGPDAYPGPN